MKLRKIIASLMGGIAILGAIGAVPVSAATAEMASPRVVVVHCPSCKVGAVSTTTSRKYQHDERFDCCHNKSGKDLYAVYEVKEVTRCDSCSYSTTKSYEDHVLKRCEGR